MQEAKAGGAISKDTRTQGYSGNRHIQEAKAGGAASKGTRTQGYGGIWHILDAGSASAGKPALAQRGQANSGKPVGIKYFSKRRRSYEISSNRRYHAGSGSCI